MNKHFPSAKSITLGIFIWGFLIVAFGLTFYAMRNSSTSSLIILSIIFLTTILFVGIVWFGTGYIISGDHIISKIGPITHSRIRISNISNISRSHSIISSPANSLKRLAIKSDQKVLALISPKNEAEFLQTITELNSGIDIDL